MFLLANKKRGRKLAGIIQVIYDVPPLADAYGGLPGGREHEEDEIDVAQYGQFLGLLENPGPPLRVRDLTAAGVLQLLDLELDPSHGGSRTAKDDLPKPRS